MTRPAAIRVSDVRRLAKAAKLEGVTVRVVLPTGVVVEISDGEPVAAITRAVIVKGRSKIHTEFQWLVPKRGKMRPVDMSSEFRTIATRGRNHTMTDQPKCGTCRWWAKIQPERPKGLCRVKPPVVVPGEGHWAVWPMSEHDDWCGEHQLKEKSDDAGRD